MFDAILLIGDVFDGGLSGVVLSEELDFWVIWVERWELFLLFLYLWIRVIGVLAFFASLKNPDRVPLCIFDLGFCFFVCGRPYIDEIEECCSRLKGICSLSSYC